MDSLYPLEITLLLALSFGAQKEVPMRLHQAYWPCSGKFIYGGGQDSLGSKEWLFHVLSSKLVKVKI